MKTRSVTRFASALVGSLALAASATAQCTGTWTEVTVPFGPSNRQNHAMAYDASRNVVVLFGGYRGGVGFNNETWEWDGKSWTQVFTASTPDPRGNFGMVYDSAREKIVLFGGAGAGGIAYGDTWEYDASGWTLVFPDNAPLGRFNHAMTYDSVRNVVLLHGGFSSVRHGDTWTFDGSTWTEVATTGLTPRNGHTMAFDHARGVAVAFGGFNGTRLDDTWEWNGTSWTQQFVAGPGGRQYLAMAYDSAREVILLFAGQNGACGECRDSDTWEYDGVAWSLVGPPGSGPGLRDQHAMAYDEQNARMVMFGGYAGGANVLADTWLYVPGQAPTITLHPSDQTVSPGVTVLIPSLAEGPGKLTYQWYKDGTALADGGPISGAQMRTLQISPVNPSHSGVYTVVVSNECGEVTSEGGRLIVLCPADWNESGTVNSQDLFDFLTDFFAENADFNNDGMTNSQDFFDFLSAFFVGCK